MASEVETLAVRRRRILTWYLAGYALWMGAQIIQGVMPNHSWDRFLVGVGSIGAIAWAAGTWELFRFQKYLQSRPRMISALNDERIQRDRLLAAGDALATVAVVNAVCLVVLVFYPHLLSGLVMAQLSIGTAVTAYIGSFLRRDAAGSEES